MPWLQLKLTTTQEYVDFITDELVTLGALSVTFEDAEDNPILEPAPGETPLWSQLKVTGLFDAECDTQTILNQINDNQHTLNSAHFEELEDKDWERAWMDNFHPMRFGQHLWIVPSWQTPPEPEATNILLDPGLAFGTGTHPTTSLCLQWLDANLVNNKSLLDYGCGSGILAIAAAKLGANPVAAIDIDPQALIATQDNMQRNGLNPEAIQLGKTDSVTEQTFDIVVANILAGPLKDLADSIHQLVAPGGSIVLSGILAEQANEIMTVYGRWFEMAHPEQLEDWVRIAGIKKQ